MKFLEPGDEIIADRGFEIGEDLPPGVLLNISPFLGDQPQFSEEDEIKTRRITKHRIHVERAIQRIKSFRILKHDLPISMAADLNKIEFEFLFEFINICHKKLQYYNIIILATGGERG